MLSIVTLVPSDDQTCAISHATGPSPIIASELGTFLAPVAFLFVHGCASVNPFTFGSILALVPVDNTTALFASFVCIHLDRWNSSSATLAVFSLFTTMR